MNFIICFESYRFTRLQTVWRTAPKSSICTTRRISCRLSFKLCLMNEVSISTVYSTIFEKFVNLLLINRQLEFGDRSSKDA